MCKKVDVLFASVKNNAHLCTRINIFVHKDNIFYSMSGKVLRYSFMPGLLKVENGKVDALKSEIYMLFGAKYSTQKWRLRKGIKEISKTRYDEITAIFEKNGVVESDVWEIAECAK